MQIHNGHVDEEIVNWVIRNAGMERVISFDMETKVLDGNFLSDEIILGISLSRRDGNKIETQLFSLENETEKGEVELLFKLDNYLQVRPLLVVGFNHRGYDNILLSTKRRKLTGNSCWAIKDMLERAQMIDVMHTARFEIARFDGTNPKILSLAKVLNHPLFADLPFKNEKWLIDSKKDKGDQIYEMWKNESEKFARYASGDSHDTLLIFEKNFKITP